MKTLDLFKSLRENNGFVWVALSTISIAGLYFGQEKTAWLSFFTESVFPMP